MTEPHRDTPTETRGPSLDEADAAVILVHGRGATATGILELSDVIGVESVAYLAPQASDRTWYPHSFLEPIDRNEPGRTAGLARLAGSCAEAESMGLARSQVAFVGFSQGACLASEFIAHNPDRYGGLAALSGGLIGEKIATDDYEGDLEEMPVFIGCSDRDPHIPVDRVQETASVFERLNAEVTVKLYPGMGHGINQDELTHVRQLIAGLLP